MSTPKAPPPPKRPPSEAEKKSAADTVAAALGGGTGVTADTGAVSAAAVKERAAAKASEERVPATPPSSKPAPPAKKPAAPASGNGKASDAPAAETAAPDISNDVLGDVVHRINETKSEVGALADTFKKYQTKTDKSFNDFREALAALMETSKATYDEVKAVQISQAGEDVRVEVRSINHGHVRVMFSTLPDEPEWLEEWAKEQGDKYDVEPAELERLAQEFGFTQEETVDDYTGRLVCIAYDEPTGV